MQPRTRIFAFGLTALLATTGLTSVPTAAMADPPSPHNTWPRKIVAFGDSFTAGFGYYADGSEMPAWALSDCKPQDAPNNACSSNSDRGSSKSGGIRFSEDYGFKNQVSWAAQVAHRMGIRTNGSQVYEIRLQGKCLDIHAGDSRNRSPLQLFDCNQTRAQQFTFDGDQIKILGKCLDVHHGDYSDGRQIELWDCNNSDAQKWTVTHARIKTKLGPQDERQVKCLTARNQGTANHTAIELQRCDGTPGQFTRKHLTSSTDAATQFRNFAVTGSTAKEWAEDRLRFEQFGDKPGLQVIEESKPDLILMTLGGNPTLSGLLFSLIDDCKFVTGDSRYGCFKKVIEKDGTPENLVKVYSRLLTNTNAVIITLSYPEVVPSVSLGYSTSSILIARDALNQTLIDAVNETKRRHPGQGYRLSAAHPHFNTGIEGNPWGGYEMKSDRGCFGLSFWGSKEYTDGPSNQSTASQAYFTAKSLLPGADAFCPGSPLVISTDTGVHPNTAGYDRMAGSAMDRWHGDWKQLSSGCSAATVLSLASVERKSPGCLRNVELAAVSNNKAIVTWKRIPGARYEYQLKGAGPTWSRTPKPRAEIPLSRASKQTVKIRAVSKPCGCEGPVYRFGLPRLR